MNYVKYLFCLAVVTSLSVSGMESEMAFMGNNAQFQANGINVRYINDTIFPEQLTACPPVLSQDFSLPVDELSIVQDIQTDSTPHSFAPEAALDAAYSSASDNFATMIQKKLFAQPQQEPARAFASSNQAPPETVVVPWTKSKRAKKSNPYDASMTVITATPNIFDRTMEGTRKRRKANAAINLEASQIQENIHSSTENDPLDEFLKELESKTISPSSNVSSLSQPSSTESNLETQNTSFKKLIQENVLLRKKKPQNKRIMQFKLTSNANPWKRQEPLFQEGIISPQNTQNPGNAINLSVLAPVSSSIQHAQKELIQTATSHRKARPQNASIIEFQLKEYGNTPAKKKRSKTALQN